MSQASKPESGPAKLDEERLAHALVSRGLVTREEVQQCRPADGPGGAKALLDRLTEAGLLTAGQARRALEELPLLMNQQIPGYQLLEKLGQGSMGTVFKARQLNLNRLVAIKVLNPRLAANPAFLPRLKREALLAAKLSHNNIVQAIDFDQAGKIHYYVMEYVEGKTIKQELEAGKVYAEREAVEIVLQIAQALEHAHRRGLIHRDIKPANIVLTPDGIAKLADLGMAREADDEALARKEKGLSIGTPYYMAPEQIEGVEDIDVRADVYSLGATFYHMVTGQVPFPGKNVEEVFQAHLGRELTPPDHVNTALSSGLGEVVEYMMARDRGQRYPTPGDLIVDLECLLNGEPPKFARQHLRAASTLEELAEGEADEEQRPRRREPRPRGVPVLWAGVLGAALALSVLLNVVLFLLRR
jgi:eukaryotic-like serine/threonine-protein kinase